MNARVLNAILVLLATATALAVPAPIATPGKASSTSSNALLQSSTIPPGYTYYAATGSSYKFHEREVSWHDASTTCAGEGAHLVVMNDAEEADIVARIVRDADYSSFPTWTGLRNNRPGGEMDWRTVNDEPLSDVYNVWEHSQPNNVFTCAYFYASNKRLNGGSCSWLCSFICEISQ